MDVLNLIYHSPGGTCTALLDSVTMLCRQPNNCNTANGPLASSDVVTKPSSQLTKQRWLDPDPVLVGQDIHLGQDRPIQVPDGWELVVDGCFRHSFISIPPTDDNAFADICAPMRSAASSLGSMCAALLSKQGEALNADAFSNVPICQFSLDEVSQY